jgi:Protein of unknown function (DUF1592)/Protein of unknown function (DUF1588)/Protein of unknown function (DUF1585)/Protein of unknown function (DUF1587)
MAHFSKFAHFALGLAALGSLPSCVGKVDNGSGDPTVVPAGEMDLTRTEMRRLTRAEVTNSLQSLLPGVTLDRSLIENLPIDPNVLFDNDSGLQQTSQTLIDAMQAIADDAATQATATAASRAALLGCTPTGPDDRACLTSFVQKFSRLALRRTLTDVELATLVDGAIAESVIDNDFFAAVRISISALLQSPEFVYVIASGDPLAATGNRVLGGYEVATRMALLLWGEIPDSPLLDKAAAGELTAGTSRRAVAELMLQDPRAARQLGRFHAMWIGYDRAENRELTDDLRGRMRREIDAMVSRVTLTENSSWFNLLTLKETYIDNTLATHYGNVPSPNSESPVWSSFGSDRSGILSTGSFFMMGAKFSDTSPTQRGLIVSKKLFCTPIPLPDPEVLKNSGESLDSPPKSSGCKIAGYNSLQDKAGCASCHATTDGIGLGLEQYDRVGRKRAFEPAGEQCPIDGKGYTMSAGSKKPFTGPGELSQLLIGNPKFEECIARQYFRFGMGRSDIAADNDTVTVAADKFRKNEFRFKDMILDVVASSSFALRKVD